MSFATKGTKEIRAFVDYTIMKHKAGVTMIAVSYSFTLIGNAEFDLNRIVVHCLHGLTKAV